MKTFLRLWNICWAGCRYFRRHPFSAVCSVGIYLAQILGVLVFFGLGFLSTLAFKLLQPCTPRNTAISRKTLLTLIRWYLWCLQTAKLFRIDLHALNELKQCRGTIIVANHPSLLDAIYLLVSVPNAFCVMRADLKSHPSTAGGARLCNFITNDSGAAFIREATRRLKGGENLLIFPEGTRTRLGRDFNSFKKGFALASIKSGAPIKTIFIKQTGMFLRSGISLIAPAKFPIHVEFEVGDTFYPIEGESTSAFGDRIEAYFHQHFSTSRAQTSKSWEPTT